MDSTWQEKVENVLQTTVVTLVRVQQESSVSEFAHLEVVLFSTVLLSDGAFPSSVLISM